MNISPFTVMLYIHPDSGPISPVPIDLLEIDKIALGTPVSSNRDDVRLTRIIKKIEERYPKVDPWSRQRDLAFLVGKISQPSSLNGYVIRLPGIIEGASLPPDTTAEDVKRMRENIQVLKGRLQEKNHTIAELKQKIPSLEKEGERLTNLTKRLFSENGDLQARLKEREETIRQAQNEIKQRNDQVAALEKENGELQTRVDALNRSQQNSLASQQEVASVQQRLQSVSKARDQLQESLSRITKEKDDLRVRYEALVNGESDVPGKQKEKRYI